MKTFALMTSWLALATLLATGCAGGPSQATLKIEEDPAVAPAAPAAGPLANPPGRLAAAPTGGGGGLQTPGPAIPVAVTPVRGMPTGVKLLDLAVAGDPTRLVLPPGHGDGTLRPALVFLHGHGMDQAQLTERTSLAQAAANEGWIAAAGAFGGRAAWGNDEALRDVGTLVQQLVAGYGADPARIYLVGFSMGGGTALLAASNPLGLPYQVAAVVSSQGFTDLKAMTTQAASGGGFARSIADAYGGRPSEAQFAAHSPQALAAKLMGVPVYLEHGENDKSVPPAHSREMAAKLDGVGWPAQLHMYPGLGHGEQTISEDGIIAFLKGKSR